MVGTVTISPRYKREDFIATTDEFESIKYLFARAGGYTGTIEEFKNIDKPWETFPHAEYFFKFARGVKVLLVPSTFFLKDVSIIDNDAMRFIECGAVYDEITETGKLLGKFPRRVTGLAAAKKLFWKLSDAFDAECKENDGTGTLIITYT